MRYHPPLDTDLHRLKKTIENTKAPQKTQKVAGVGARRCLALFCGRTAVTCHCEPPQAAKQSPFRPRETASAATPPRSNITASLWKAASRRRATSQAVGAVSTAAEKPQKTQKTHREHRSFSLRLCFLCTSALILDALCVLGALGISAFSASLRYHPPLDTDLHRLKKTTENTKAPQKTQKVAG